MDDITEKLVEAKFLIRTLGEQIHAGQAKPSDVRAVRKKVNSLLKDIGITVKDGGG